MTETEWMVCEDPAQMIAALEGRCSDRKLRLFAVAVGYRCRPIARKPKEKFEVVVRFADGLADLKAIRKYWGRLRPGGTWPERPFSWAHAVACDCQRGEPDCPPPAELVPLLRDIFGNPVRPVSLDPAWLTTDVLALARGIYDDRAFDRMPILADALQDAGCTNENILSHCRDANPVHVRGCWVLDLILGKT